MKNLLKVLTGVGLLCLFTSCTFLTGLDAPENFDVYAHGRELTFSWDDVPGADYYIIQTTGGGKDWADEEVKGTKLVLDNWNNLLNWHEYKFTVRPVKSNGIKGPVSDTVKAYIPYGFEKNTMEFSKKEWSKSSDGGVTFTWDNIKTRSGEHIGVKGITYMVFRQEGEDHLGLWREETASELEMIADGIKPSSDKADEKLTYVDTTVEAGKKYKYYVQAYSTYYHWDSDSYITPGLNGIDIKYVVVED